MFVFYSGCEYAVPSEWSQCERNGHKYRSKKLMSGPPVCSQVVEEVEQCRSNPPLLTDLSINYILNQKPKPTQPNTPTDKKQPSKNKPSTDAAPKKQPMKEDKQEKMSKGNKHNHVQDKDAYKSLGMHHRMKNCFLLRIKKFDHTFGVVTCLILKTSRKVHTA